MVICGFSVCVRSKFESESVSGASKLFANGSLALRMTTAYIAHIFWSILNHTFIQFFIISF